MPSAFSVAAPMRQAALFHVGGDRPQAQALDDPECSLNLRIGLDRLARLLPEILGPDRGGT